LGLFSLITLLAHQAAQRGQLPIQQTAWYAKPLPTFSDALALVRDRFWRHLYFYPSLPQADTLKIPLSMWLPVADTACFVT
jgi:hypothetical protein